MQHIFHLITVGVPGLCFIIQENLNVGIKTIYTILELYNL